MRNEVNCGFVMIEHCQLIVRLKLKLILLGVAAHSLQELEEYGSKQHGELSAKDLQQWKRTELNLGYLVDVIDPEVLQLNIFEFVEKPLKYKTVMKAYRLTAEELRLLENYRVTWYNADF